MGRITTKELAAQILCRAGLPAMARRRNRKRLAILMYHGVDAEPLSPHCWHVLNEEAFRRGLEYVRDHFQVLHLHDALERMSAGTLPDNAAALTFDDGTRNLLTHAAPVLRQLRLPAAVFLSTGPLGSKATLWPDRLWLAIARTEVVDLDLTDLGMGIRSLHDNHDRGAAYSQVVNLLKSLPDNERLTQVDALCEQLGQGDIGDGGPFTMLNWDEVHALAEDGLITLYPHTVTHPILSTCSDEKVEHEISESCDALARETGQAPRIFAYPNGRVQDFDQRAKEALRRNHVRWALATTYGFAHAGSDPLALPRLPIGSDLSWAGFQLVVSGAAP